MAIDRDALRAWVEASCSAQGIPVVVTDPGIIAQVGGLVRLGGTRGGSRQGAQRVRRGSQAPSGNDPVRIDSVARPARHDRREVENRRNDRSLSS